MHRPMIPFDRFAAPLAAALCLSAALGFALAFPEYSHLRHPLALLGARGVPRALAFNLTAFVVPGALAALVALRVHARVPAAAGLPARLGAWLLAISALAWGAQGLLPLEPSDLEGAVSQWHATAWMIWWLAFVSAAWLLALGLCRCPGRRGLVGALAVAGGLTVVLNAVPGVWMPGPLAQRAVAAVWWLCVIAVSRLR